MTAIENSARQRHLLIAGPGRAGTSFLVEYLDKLGLETEIARSGYRSWHERARAGLETRPMVTSAKRWPYVIKTPWAFEFIDQLLAQNDVALDAVFIPVRDLVQAAASRVIVERCAIYENAPWMARLESVWESWAETPGGVVYSLNALDQARILAIGFQRLVQRLVEVDVPIILLAFPRLVQDSEYLFRKIREFLPAHVTRETAEAAHRAVARPDLVRVTDELALGRAGLAPDASSTAVQYPDATSLDVIALRRELVRLQSEVQLMRRQRDAALRWWLWSGLRRLWRRFTGRTGL